MNKSSQAIILILLLIIGYLIYDKITTRPTTYQVKEQASVNTSKTAVSPEIKKVNRDCMVAAENFFEQIRAKNIDLYSATWNEYYEESSGICFVGIKFGGWESSFNFEDYTSGGLIYNVKTGEIYHLVDGVFTKTVN